MTSSPQLVKPEREIGREIAPISLDEWEIDCNLVFWHCE